jgi:hypothetical protein
MTTKTRRGRRIDSPVYPQHSPTVIEFVLDETGSMTGVAAQAVAGFNDFLSEQREVPGLCQMSLTKFEGHNLRTPYEDLPLQYVPNMTGSMFRPAGMTNLRDAIVARVTSLTQRLVNWTVQPKVLLVAMTDGGDNISRNTEMTVRLMLAAGREKGWTSVYLGADQDALRIGQSLGFDEGNIKSFASANIRETMQDLSSATTVYRSAAGSSTRNFF